MLGGIVGKEIIMTLIRTIVHYPDLYVCIIISENWILKNKLVEAVFIIIFWLFSSRVWAYWFMQNRMGPKPGAFEWEERCEYELMTEYTCHGAAPGQWRRFDRAPSCRICPGSSTHSNCRSSGWTTCPAPRSTPLCPWSVLARASAHLCPARDNT